MMLCWPKTTLSFSFDDGFLSHYQIAAPMLEKYGWVGTFNIPTDYIRPAKRELTDEVRKDFNLPKNDEGFMSWDDLRDLVKRGHEVYPHSCDHSDLRDAEKAGDFAKVDRQIRESKAAFVREVGIAPKFYCSPHNSVTSYILRQIHKNGMELFTDFRVNFGEGTIPGTSSSVLSFIKERVRAGYPHIELMVHGLEPSRGGWKPFASLLHFEAFLDEVRQAEQAGLVRVVPYSSVHCRYVPLISRVNDLWARLYSAGRRFCFRRFTHGY